MEFFPPNFLVVIKFRTSIAKFFPYFAGNFSNRVSVLTLLISFDMLVVFCNNPGWSFSAIELSRPERVGGIIHLECRYNKKDTPFYCTLQFQSYTLLHLKSMNLFLKLGLDPNVTDNYGRHRKCYSDQIAPTSISNTGGRGRSSRSDNVRWNSHQHAEECYMRRRW